MQEIGHMCLHILYNEASCCEACIVVVSCAFVDSEAILCCLFDCLETLHPPLVLVENIPCKETNNVIS